MSGEESGWFNAGMDFSGDDKKLLFEQYKLYVDTSTKVSDRRGAANTFLMSVNTALVTVFGLIAGKDASLDAADGPWRWLLPLAGLAICLGWLGLIRSYRLLNRAKFAVISELEHRLPARLFDYEWHHLNQGKTWRFSQLTQIEQLVPAVFAVIYAILLVAAVRA